MPAVTFSEVLRQGRRWLGAMRQPVQRRPLTHGEQALVDWVFAGQIDTRRVRLHAAHWVLPGYAVSPNGQVYFNPADFCPDFSRQPLALQGWFIHEMTHVWQVQQGIRVLRRALLDRRYGYVLEVGKPFLKYGIEQQAQMVQDWFLARMRGEDCGKWACVPFASSPA